MPYHMMSQHIIWYHNISYDITTCSSHISYHSIEAFHACYDQGRFEAFRNRHLDTKYFESWERCKKKFKNWFDTSQSPLGFFQDFRSLVLQKIGHSLANRQAKAQPLWPHPSMLPPWGKTEENSCFVLTPASKWYILYKFRRNRKQCRLLEVFLELIKPRSVWGILVQRLLDTSFAPKSCPDISWKMACKAPHLPSGVDSLRRNSVKNSFL